MNCTIEVNKTTDEQLKEKAHLYKGSASHRYGVDLLCIALLLTENLHVLQAKGIGGGCTSAVSLSIA